MSRREASVPRLTTVRPGSRPRALEASRRGAAPDFEAIYARHHQELYRYCFSILQRREDAEDALQATMAAALRSLPGETRSIALRPWLYRVAHNESITLIRRRRATLPLDDATIGAADSTETQLRHRDRIRQLVADLQALPDRQRSAIVMRELSGLSYDEIGEALSASEAAARQTVYEARVALNDLAEGREMECEAVRRELSDGDGRRLRGRRIRAHLKACEGCRGFADLIAQRSSDLQAICPVLPALAASTILSGLLGGAGGGAAAGVGAGAAGVGAGASAAGVGGAAGAGLAGSAAIKGASVLATVVLAAGAADVGGVVDLPGLGGRSAPAERPSESAGDGSGPGSGDGRIGSSAAPGREGIVATGSGSPAEGGSGVGPDEKPGSGGRGGAGQTSEAAARPHGTPGGRSDEAPGQTDASGSAPGHSGSSLGKSAQSPGRSGAPGRSGSAPGKSESSAAKGGGSVGEGSAGSAASAGNGPATRPEGKPAAAPPPASDDGGPAPPESPPKPGGEKGLTKRHHKR